MSDMKKDQKDLNAMDERTHEELAAHQSKRNEVKPDSTETESLALDDARRLKVLSPGMLVLRRFLRNRLAIAGVIILVVMFLFSFIGGMLMPYSQDQTFRKDVVSTAEFAGVTRSRDFRYESVEGADFPSYAQSQFVSAIDEERDSFEAAGVFYDLEPINEEAYIIWSNQAIAKGLVMGSKSILTFEEGFDPIPGLEAALGEAVKNDEKAFELNDEEFTVQKIGKEYQVSQARPTTLAAIRGMNYDSPDDDLGLGFQIAAERAITDNNSEFLFEDESYRLDAKSEARYTITDADGKIVALLSNYYVQPIHSSDFLDLGFKEAVLTAIDEGAKEFEYEGARYPLEKKHLLWSVRYETVKTVYDDYAPPSKAHPLGTDSNGMDSLTRLMYGGRVSLMVGFISVLISLTIGIILGGLAGYFSGWVDMIVMRMADISYCIPTYPILIIVGSVMDEFEIQATQRLVYLMIILGVMGWSGIARMVRGQILSLREQEFMTAAEATGLSVHRRIYRHLIPNVIPQLIVTATMSLGGTIITESTLSYLGLGVKFPYASWGNIINSVSSVHVMTNYPQAWIPAGICMLVTVLAFNFVGDGLRDAFDPRMKR